jgi:hypothetical protein
LDQAMNDEKSLVMHALIAIGVSALSWAAYILLQGEFSSRAGTTTREEHPIAFFITVLVIALTGAGLVLLGLGKI